MKKLATVLITICLVTGLSTSAFAFGPGLGGYGRYDNSRGYERRWHDAHRGHENGRYVYVPRYSHNAPYHGSGAVISLPLAPVPAISLFPSINVSIH